MTTLYSNLHENEIVRKPKENKGSMIIEEHKIKNHWLKFKAGLVILNMNPCSGSYFQIYIINKLKNYFSETIWHISKKNKDLSK